MSDEIKTKLKAACVGRPATIPWPHYVLHEAHDRIEALEADLAAATARADALAETLSSMRDDTAGFRTVAHFRRRAAVALAAIQEDNTDD